MCDPRFEILFEPVQVEPRIARNRFYQVPHCNGLGHFHATAMATLRGIKAEGGWAVVSTEQCEMHPSADSAPLVNGGFGTTVTCPLLSGGRTG